MIGQHKRMKVIKAFRLLLHSFSALVYSRVVKKWVLTIERGSFHSFLTKSTHCDLKSKKALTAASLSTLVQPAFTLAEVLIVIGIIGIVANLTIPSLMHDIQE